MIYFIQATSGGPIKIGWASNPWQRAAGLQTGNPEKLTVLATMRGERAEEAALHERFAALRTQGEWFASGPALVGFIDGVLWSQRENPPQPMDVEPDLFGLTHDQMEAIAEAIDGLRDYRRAAMIVVDYYDTSPLPPEILVDAISLSSSFRLIDKCLAEPGGKKYGHYPSLLGAAYFDGASSYNREELTTFLEEMVSRHEMSIAEARLAEETTMPALPTDVHPDSPTQAPITVANDQTVN